MTQYIVLTRSGAEADWVALGRMEAASQHQAKQKAVESVDLNEGAKLEVVAIPSRSWDPETVTKTVKTSLVWGETKEEA